MEKKDTEEKVKVTKISQTWSTEGGIANARVFHREGGRRKLPRTKTLKKKWGNCKMKGDRRAISKEILPRALNAPG